MSIIMKTILTNYATVNVWEQQQGMSLQVKLIWFGPIAQHDTASPILMQVHLLKYSVVDVIFAWYLWHTFCCSLLIYSFCNTCVESEHSTWQDKEDSWNKGKDGAMGSNVSNITEHKTNKHEE